MQLKKNQKRLTASSEKAEADIASLLETIEKDVHPAKECYPDCLCWKLRKLGIWEDVLVMAHKKIFPKLGKILLFFFMLLIPSISLGQNITIVNVSTIGYKNIIPASNPSQFMNVPNYYLLQSLTSGLNATLEIVNNDSVGGHSLIFSNIQFYNTANPSNTAPSTYLPTSCYTWTSTTTALQTTLIQNTGAITINPSSAYFIQCPQNGGTNIAILLQPNTGTSTSAQIDLVTSASNAPIVTPVNVSIGPNVISGYSNVLDPCQSPFVTKSSVAINITTATTTTLIAPTSLKTPYVCVVTIDAVVSSSSVESFQFIYGTGATCGTGTISLTGAMQSGASTGLGPVFFSASGNTLFNIPVSNGLCMTTVQVSGTVMGVQGWISYILQ